jgi:hypothetical protein
MNGHGATYAVVTPKGTLKRAQVRGLVAMGAGHPVVPLLMARMLQRNEAGNWMREGAGKIPCARGAGPP